MTTSVSLEHLPQLTMTEMHKSMLDNLINGTPVGYVGASGAGKTTTLFDISSKISAADLMDHPINQEEGRSIDRVIPIVINCAQYDAYTFRGIIVPGETTIDEATGKKETKSSLTVPVWFSDVRACLAKYPTAHVCLGIDEFNVADPEFQSCLLQLLSEGRVGPHRLPMEDRMRVSYMFLGNRPEDLPSSFTLIGPLAQRAWWYQVKPTAKEVLGHLDAAGAASPEVHWFLNEHPSAVFVHGLTDDGACLELNNMKTSDDGDGDETTVTPCANAVNPRRWMQVSRRLQRMRADGTPTSMRIKILGGAVPRPIALELATAMEIADTFATLDEVVANPASATVPEGALLQSMQIRSLMPRLDDDNVPMFVEYARRFSNSACSGIVAYLNASGRGNKRMLNSEREGGMSQKARLALSTAFIDQYTAGLGVALGLDVRHSVVPAPEQPPVAPTAATVPVAPQVPTVPAAPVASQPQVPTVPAVPAATATAAAPLPPMSAAIPAPVAMPPAAPTDDGFEW